MKIGFILDSIDNGTIVLPEFQRGYVWSRDQVKGLVRSLYQEYPVGGLLVWNTDASATEVRGGNAVGTVKLLLDGQQRITSLYGVMRGTPPPFFEDAGKAKAFIGLHFNLETEDFEFHKPTVMDADPLWVSVTDLFLRGPEDLTDALEEIDGISVKQLSRYINRAQRLHKIGNVDLHDENLSGADKTIDVVVEIFNRVNSGGTKLSKGDLALARICAIRSTARGELRDALDRWRAAGFDLTLDWLLRCVNVVTTGRGRFEALANVDSPAFGDGLLATEKAIDFVLNLLVTRLGLDHDRVLMGRYGIPAMVRVVHEEGGAITDTATQDQLLFWYITQAAWGRYSGSTETVLDRDLTAIRADGLDGLIAELEVWRGTLDMRPTDFDTQSTGSRFYPILYMLSRVSEARDLGNGMPLSAHLLGKGSKLEVHHIFPKAYLYAHGYEQRHVNAVANFAFLTAASNKTVSATPPVTYFPSQEHAHPGVLASQWISDDDALWEVDRYHDFLADRRQRLADATNALLRSLRGGAGDVVAKGTSGGVEDELDPGLLWLAEFCAAHGLAAPETEAVIADPATGELAAYVTAAWLDGLQPGLTEPLALLLEGDRDPEGEARLNQLGFRYFTSRRTFVHHVEELLGIDIDGDGVIGPVDEPADDDTLDEDIAEATADGGPPSRRRRSAIVQLVTDRAIADGTVLTLRPATDVGPAVREQIKRWVEEDPRRGRAEWRNDRKHPLVWELDGQGRRPTKLLQEILEAADTGVSRTGRATMWWVLPDGRDLVDAAHGVGPGEAPGTFDAAGLHSLLERVPAGAWTSYGDLARAMGSGPQAVAGHISACDECPGGWRVVGTDGRPRMGFRWLEPNDDRTQQQALEAEGVRFIDGVADGGQRVSDGELRSP